MTCKMTYIRPCIKTDEEKTSHRICAGWGLKGKHDTVASFRQFAARKRKPLQGAERETQLHADVSEEKRSFVLQLHARGQRGSWQLPVFPLTFILWDLKTPDRSDFEHLRTNMRVTSTGSASQSKPNTCYTFVAAQKILFSPQNNKCVTALPVLCLKKSQMGSYVLLKPYLKSEHHPGATVPLRLLCAALRLPSILLSIPPSHHPSPSPSRASLFSAPASSTGDRWSAVTWVGEERKEKDGEKAGWEGGRERERPSSCSSAVCSVWCLRLGGRESELLVRRIFTSETNPRCLLSSSPSSPLTSPALLLSGVLEASLSLFLYPSSSTWLWPTVSSVGFSFLLITPSNTSPLPLTFGFCSSVRRTQ